MNDEIVGQVKQSVVEFIKPLTYYLDLKFLEIGEEFVKYQWAHIEPALKDGEKSIHSKIEEYITNDPRIIETAIVTPTNGTRGILKSVRFPISEFIEIGSLLDKNQTHKSIPYESSCFSPTYFEQLIEIDYWDTDLYSVKNINYQPNSEMKIYIKENISFNFLVHILSLLQTGKFPKGVQQLLDETKQITSYIFPDLISKNVISLKDLLIFQDYKFLVIENHGFTEENIKTHLKKLTNALSFNYMFNFDVSIRGCKNFTASREPEYENLREKLLGVPSFPLNLKQQYDPDLLQFYEMGVTSYLPNVQFLGFYQVLESFFLKIAYKKIYTEMENILKHPGFRNSKTDSLEELRLTVDKYQKRTDETAKLIMVINHFIPEDQIIEFIQKMEGFVGDKLFSRSGTYFGQEMMVQLREGQAISNLAKIIKHTRNAIVHSTDTYESNPRYRPFAEEDQKIVEKIIPVLRFLAEKIMISEAIPME